MTQREAGTQEVSAMHGEVGYVLTGPSEETVSRYISHLKAAIDRALRGTGGDRDAFARLGLKREDFEGLGPIGRLAVFMRAQAALADQRMTSALVRRLIGRIPACDDRVKAHGFSRNLITANGDQYCAKKIYSSPTAMANMKLGELTTTPTKTGAGSYITTTSDYVSGSAHACDESSPKAGATNDIVYYAHTWAAGEATNANINRFAVVDNVTDAGEADATHTLLTALLDPKPVPKGASDTLKILDNVTFLAT